MAGKYNENVFERINQIKGDITKVNSISEELLLKESFRKIFLLNKSLNLGYHIHFPIGVLFPNVLAEGVFFETLNTHWRGWLNRDVGDYGHLLEELFLAWDFFSEDEKIIKLSQPNPYEYIIRILERGFTLEKEEGKILQISSGTRLRFYYLLSEDIYQDIPYIISSEDMYLDKINDYYEQYKVLPSWLEEDNKRGYLL